MRASGTVRTTTAATTAVSGKKQLIEHNTPPVIVAQIANVTARSRSDASPNRFRESPITAAVHSFNVASPATITGVIRQDLIADCGMLMEPSCNAR